MNLQKSILVFSIASVKSKTYFVLTILMFGLFLGFSIEHVNAQTVSLTEERILLYDNLYNSKNPVIYGEYIVWQDERNGNEDIYMYEISTGTETRITTDPEDQIYPAIHGDYIVWTDKRISYDDIYMYEISTGTETRITTDSADQRWPAVSGDYIVWEDNRHGNKDIYMYEISTGTETRITTDPADQIYPAIRGNHIVWTDHRNFETSYTDIYMYEISTGTETRVSAGWLYEVQPDIYGDYIVWRDSRNQPTSVSDIYMYEISTGTETRITTDPADQSWPSIYGDYIVWEDERNGNEDIYMYEISTGIETQLTTNPADQTDIDFYGDFIVWEDNRHGDFDIYVGELSFSSPPPSAIEQAENILSIVGDDSEIPTRDFYGIKDKVKENRRKAIMGKMGAVINDIESALQSTDLSIQVSASQSALNNLNSILEKNDGCSERGMPDTKGSGYTIDWIVTCVSQAKVDPLLRDLITTLETILVSIT